MKNVIENAKVTGNAWVFDDAQVSGNAQVFGNARVYGNAQVSGNALVFGDAQVSGNVRVFGDAQVFGDTLVSGNALVYGNAWVFGDAWVFGEADIQSNNDWFSFIYEGKTLTGYRSRNELGYELNIDGLSKDITDLKYGFDGVVQLLIKNFTPFEPVESKETTELKSVISDLEKQLEEAKARLQKI